MPGDSRLAVETPSGLVRHVGTQYEVRLDGSDVRLRVREGRIEWRSNSGTVERGQAGEQLMIAADGAVRREQASRYDASWDWIASTTPAIDIEGRPLAEFLSWAGRELGREVVFATPEVAEETAAIVVHGSIEGLTPTQALDAVLATTSVRGSLEEGRIVVRTDARTMIQTELAAAETIKNSFEDHARVMADAATVLPEILDRVAADLHACFTRGNKLLACGNGGSASDAEHLVAELVGRYRDERRGLPAITLVARIGHGHCSRQRLRLRTSFCPPGRSARAAGGLVVRNQHQRPVTQCRRGGARRAQSGCTVTAFTGAVEGPLAARGGHRCCGSVNHDCAHPGSARAVHPRHLRVIGCADAGERVSMIDAQSDEHFRLSEILDRCQGREVWVVGDLMLDQYVQGAVERISPEAPVPIVTVRDVEYRLGGAANVARQITALGGRAVLGGVIGDDDTAKRFWRTVLRPESIAAPC